MGNIENRNLTTGNVAHETLGMTDRHDTQNYTQTLRRRTEETTH